jgi:hypothetical protein
MTPPSAHAARFFCKQKLGPCPFLWPTPVADASDAAFYSDLPWAARNAVPSSSYIKPLRLTAFGSFNHHFPPSNPAPQASTITSSVICLVALGLLSSVPFLFTHGVLLLQRLRPRPRSADLGAVDENNAVFCSDSLGPVPEASLPSYLNPFRAKESR